MGILENKTPTGADSSGEAQLRGGALSNDETRTSVDRLVRGKSQDTDAVLRTDEEEDTLYDDGLELENASRTLTGVNGKDDSR